MTTGIIGVGAVGIACAKAMLLRGTCADLVLVDLPERAQHTQGVANDLSHGEPLCAATRIRPGGYNDLAGADIIVITAGINEAAGGATDRADLQGRLRLLPRNAAIYGDVIPAVVRVNPQAPIVVVTDPPDALADVARVLVRSNGGENAVLSTGTLLDSLRFRIQIGRKLGCDARGIDAMVIGEHGTSQVYVWSSARAGGAGVLDLAGRLGMDAEVFRAGVEAAVKFANIDIIQGTGASQHGIGIVTARIVEAMLRDEGAVFPIGVWQATYGVTLSLPGVVGRTGVRQVIEPALSEAERAALERSADVLRAAVQALA